MDVARACSDHHDQNKITTTKHNTTQQQKYTHLLLTAMPLDSLPSVLDLGDAAHDIHRDGRRDRSVSIRCTAPSATTPPTATTPKRGVRIWPNYANRGYGSDSDTESTDAVFNGEDGGTCSDHAIARNFQDMMKSDAAIRANRLSNLKRKLEIGSPASIGKRACGRPNDPNIAPRWFRYNAQVRAAYARKKTVLRELKKGTVLDSSVCTSREAALDEADYIAFEQHMQLAMPLAPEDDGPYIRPPEDPLHVMDDDYQRVMQHIDLSEQPVYSMDTIVAAPPVHAYDLFEFCLATAPDIEQHETEHPRVPIALDKPIATGNRRTTSRTNKDKPFSPRPRSRTRSGAQMRAGATTRWYATHELATSGICEAYNIQLYHSKKITTARRQLRVVVLGGVQLIVD